MFLLSPKFSRLASLSIAFAAAALVLITMPCSSAEITHTSIGNNTGFLTVFGRIELGDEQRFLAAASNYSKGAVLFRSDGGNLHAGLQMGEIIRLRGFSTGVAPGSRCASACALAWLGGTSRYMSSSSLIGFHAAWRLRDGEMHEVGMGNALVGAYLTRLGLPLSAVAYATRAGPKDITWLTPDDAKNVGIEVAMLDLEPPSGSRDATEMRPEPPSKRTTARNYFFVANTKPPDDFLALRTLPSASSGNRIARLPNGTLLDVLERRSDGWWRIRVKETAQEGWVKSGERDKSWLLCCSTGNFVAPEDREAEQTLLALSCDQLWLGRNTIWKEAGYCFKTTRAISAFGNSGCRYDATNQIALSQENQNLLSAIRRAETSKGCVQ